MSIIFPPVVDTYQQGHMNYIKQENGTSVYPDLSIAYEDSNEITSYRQVEISIRDQYNNRSALTGNRETLMMNQGLATPYEDFIINKTITVGGISFTEDAGNPAAIHIQGQGTVQGIEGPTLGWVSLEEGKDYTFFLEGDPNHTLPVSLLLFAWEDIGDGRFPEFSIGNGETVHWDSSKGFKFGAAILQVHDGASTLLSQGKTVIPVFKETEAPIEDYIQEPGAHNVVISHDYFSLSPNTWYKVQLRFVYYDDNLRVYKRSEWSTITLLKASSYFSVELTSPPPEMSVLTTGFLTVTGQMLLDQPTADDRLSSYNIKVIQHTVNLDGVATSLVIEKSGTQYPNSQSALQFGPYALRTNFRDTEDIEYEIVITYITSGMYQGTVSSGRFIVLKEIVPLEGDMCVSPINEKGYNEIQLGLTQADIDANSVFYIQRSSYKDNRGARDTLFTINLKEYGDTYPQVPLILSKDKFGNNRSVLSCTHNLTEESKKDYAFAQVFADMTAEPGVLYYYTLSDQNGHDYQCTYEDGTAASEIGCMLDGNDLFFIDKNASFCINMNPSISSMKYVVQESVTNTIGSAYPFVRRNGNTKYRQFNVSGTICGYGDQDGILLSEDNAYGIIADVFYRDYLQKNRITPWSNYLFERIYRDTAIAFLMDGQPKVFKSQSEGAMIVMLTGVSFTPNTQLNRMIYDFSATVTEIAKCDIQNCQKYHCYEPNGAALKGPSEYYLVVEDLEEGDSTFSAVQEGLALLDQAQAGYLCLQEVQKLLAPYVAQTPVQGVLDNDSLRR